MNKVKTILYALALASITSAVCYYIGRHTSPRATLYKTLMQKPDTVFSYLHINKKGSGYKIKGNEVPSGEKTETVICKTDIDAASNFRADIKYYPQSDLWDNSYTVPARTIFQKEIQKFETLPAEKRPHWAFGIGASAGYTGSSFSVRPAVSIGMALPYKSVELSLDLKLEPLFGNSFQLNPYINGQIKIRF